MSHIIKSSISFLIAIVSTSTLSAQEPAEPYLFNVNRTQAQSGQLYEYILDEFVLDGITYYSTATLQAVSQEQIGLSSESFLVEQYIDRLIIDEIEHTLTDIEGSPGLQQVSVSVEDPPVLVEEASNEEVQYYVAYSLTATGTFNRNTGYVDITYTDLTKLTWNLDASESVSRVVERHTAILGPNEAPTISAIEDQVYSVGQVPANLDILFNIDDAETPIDELEVTASSSNQELLPDTSITLSGSGNERQLSVVVNGTLSGISTVTLEVSDGWLTTTTTFDIIVRSGVVIAITGGTTGADGDVLGLRSLAVGDPVFEGDQIITGAVEGTSVVLRMADNSIITLYDDSVVVISKSRKPESGGFLQWLYSLARGKIKVDDPISRTPEENDNWRLRTRTIALGKRGTTFTVSTTDDASGHETSLSVESGSVFIKDLSSGNTSILDVDESATITTNLSIFSPEFLWLDQTSGSYDFFTESGFTYTLERSTDLPFSEESTTVIDSVIGDGMPTSLSFASSQQELQAAFYRLKKEATTP